MENVYLEVDFEKYCKTCEHKDLDEKCADLYEIESAVPKQFSE